MILPVCTAYHVIHTKQKTNKRYHTHHTHRIVEYRLSSGNALQRTRERYMGRVRSLTSLSRKKLTRVKRTIESRSLFCESTSLCMSIVTERSMPARSAMCATAASFSASEPPYKETTHTERAFVNSSAYHNDKRAPCMPLTCVARGVNECVVLLSSSRGSSLLPLVHTMNSSRDETTRCTRRCRLSFVSISSDAVVIPHMTSIETAEKPRHRRSSDVHRLIIGVRIMNWK